MDQVIVQQGAMGRWRWRVPGGDGKTMMLSTAYGFETRDEARLDAIAKLTLTASMLRAPWWALDKDAHVAERVAGMISYEPHKNHMPKETGDETEGV